MCSIEDCSVSIKQYPYRLTVNYYVNIFGNQSDK